MLGDLEGSLGQSWTASFVVLTSGQETVLACRGAEPLGTDPCSGRGHLLGVAWAGCQGPGVKSSDIWVTMRTDRSWREEELFPVSPTGRQSGSKGVRSAGAKLRHRRGDPHGKVDRISAAPSLFPRLQGCSFPGAAVTSRHTRDSKQQKCVVSQLGGQSPQIQGSAGHSPSCGPRGGSFPPASPSFSRLQPFIPWLGAAASSFCLFFAWPSLSVWIPASPAKDPVYWIEDPTYIKEGLPQWLSRQRICLQCRKWEMRVLSGRCPGGEMATTLVFLSGKSHGQKRSLAGCSPWGHKESDMTEHAFPASRVLPSQDSHLTVSVKTLLHSGSRRT